MDSVTIAPHFFVPRALSRGYQSGAPSHLSDPSDDRDGAAGDEPFLSPVIPATRNLVSVIPAARNDKPVGTISFLRDAKVWSCSWRHSDDSATNARRIKVIGRQNCGSESSCRLVPHASRQSPISRRAAVDGTYVRKKFAKCFPATVLASPAQVRSASDPQKLSSVPLLPVSPVKVV
jgi:hypothetical protein